MSWENTEVKALDFIKTNFDPAAYLVGGADSTKSDIFSPKYDCYIEVKDLLQGDVSFRSIYRLYPMPSSTLFR